MLKMTMNDLTLSVDNSTDTVVMKWIGECSEIDPHESLVPFLNESLTLVQNQIIIQFQELTFMNSSIIHPLILFIKNLHQRNVKIQLQYDKNSSWQISSFKTFKTLFATFTNIEVIEV